MSLRIGFGTDLHRLAPGDGLWIGGVKVPCGVAAQATSDGDVLLHALVDALLGAAGLGDIGECYPEAKARPGEPSSRFVRETVAVLRERGMRVVNVDLVVDLERPKLGGWKETVKANVAGLLGVDPALVNVKAKTGEGLGPVGNGEAVAAQAAALVEILDQGGRST